MIVFIATYLSVVNWRTGVNRQSPVDCYCKIGKKMESIVPNSFRFRIMKFSLSLLLAGTALGSAFDIGLMIGSPPLLGSGLRICVILINLIVIVLGWMGLFYLRINFLWTAIAFTWLGIIFSLVLRYLLKNPSWPIISLILDTLICLFAFLIIREMNIARNLIVSGQIELYTTSQL